METHPSLDTSPPQPTVRVSSRPLCGTPPPPSPTHTTSALSYLLTYFFLIIYSSPLLRSSFPYFFLSSFNSFIFPFLILMSFHLSLFPSFLCPFHSFLHPYDPSSFLSTLFLLSSFLLSYLPSFLFVLPSTFPSFLRPSFISVSMSFFPFLLSFHELSIPYLCFFVSFLLVLFLSFYLASFLSLIPSSHILHSFFPFLYLSSLCVYLVTHVERNGLVQVEASCCDMDIGTFYLHLVMPPFVMTRVQLSARSFIYKHHPPQTEQKMVPFMKHKTRPVEQFFGHKSPHRRHQNTCWKKRRNR